MRTRSLIRFRMALTAAVLAPVIVPTIKSRQSAKGVLANKVAVATLRW